MIFLALRVEKFLLCRAVLEGGLASLSGGAAAE
jgi:hypothetical protein